jgi:hypothetical protein
MSSEIMPLNFFSVELAHLLYLLFAKIKRQSVLGDGLTQCQGEGKECFHYVL